MNCAGQGEILFTASQLQSLLNFGSWYGQLVQPEECYVYDYGADRFAEMDNNTNWSGEIW